MVSDIWSSLSKATVWRFAGSANKFCLCNPNQVHRQNLFAKPANLHNQGHLHNPHRLRYVKLKSICCSRVRLVGRECNTVPWARVRAPLQIVSVVNFPTKIRCEYCRKSVCPPLNQNRRSERLSGFCGTWKAECRAEKLMLHWPSPSLHAGTLGWVVIDLLLCAVLTWRALGPW